MSYSYISFDYFNQNKKYMKRVVVFAMVLMLGVVSVQAQWSVVPEAGMTV